MAADLGKTPITANQNKIKVTASEKAKVIKTYGKLPLYFIENKGQVDEKVSFYERGAGHATFFTSKGVVIGLTKRDVKAEKTALHGGIKDLKAKKPEKVTTEAVALSFVGANNKAKITAGDKKTGHANYFVGNDKSKWKSNIPTYGAVTYKDIYKKIDIKFYGNNRQLEHDVIVRPGGDLLKARFAYKGIQGLKITEEGGLEVSLIDGKLIEKKPVIYQEIDGKRVIIKGSYRIFKSNKENFTYGFNVASYDHTKDLVIDPVLVYSTYLGGSAQGEGMGIAVDSSGAVYVTGYTVAADFPIANPLQAAIRGSTDAYVTKINPAGTALVYSTYLGGGSGEIGYAIAVDASGAAYVTGNTTSTDFPLMNPIQGVYGGGTHDAFITKLNPAGSALVWSTYLGGNGYDFGKSIAVDTMGNAYVSGKAGSTDFPLMNPIQAALRGQTDAFVTKINPAGSALVYSTYLGGSADELENVIAVDATGNAYVGGYTTSRDFPLMNPIQGAFGGGFYDVFISKINPVGSALVWSTYLGGSRDEQGVGIAVDAAGSAYVVGYTSSTDFPLMSPIQGVFGGGTFDAFVTKINPAGSALVYSTYLGGSGYDLGARIAVDNGGFTYVTGWTLSTDFPLMNPIQATVAGLTDAFITKINPGGSAFVWSTYLGGINDDNGNDIAVDSAGAAYVTGSTASSDFPTVNPLQGVKVGPSFDAFIAKIGGTPPPPTPTVTLAITPDAVSVPRGGLLGYSVTLTNTTASRQCFQYWENVTLPGGFIYPANGNGSIYNPVPRPCFAAGVSYTVHLTHRVPFTAPLGAYTFNSYDGIYPPGWRVVVDSASFNFNVTGFGGSPLNTRASSASWPLIERGFKK